MEYVNFNMNPKKKKTADCVLRAVAFGLGQEYVETYREMVESSIKTGYFMSDKKGYQAYLKSKGYEMEKMPRKDNNKRYTVAEFCDILAKNGETYIISVANHLTVIKDKKLYDIWNCGRKSVGNYWIINNKNDNGSNTVPVRDTESKKQNKSRILL